MPLLFPSVDLSSAGISFADNQGRLWRVFDHRDEFGVEEASAPGTHDTASYRYFVRADGSERRCYPLGFHSEREANVGILIEQLQDAYPEIELAVGGKQ